MESGAPRRPRGIHRRRNRSPMPRRGPSGRAEAGGRVEGVDPTSSRLPNSLSVRVYLHRRRSTRTAKCRRAHRLRSRWSNRRACSLVRRRDSSSVRSARRPGLVSPPHPGLSESALRSARSDSSSLRAHSTKRCSSEPPSRRCLHSSRRSGRRSPERLRSGRSARSAR